MQSCIRWTLLTLIIFSLAACSRSKSSNSEPESLQSTSTGVFTIEPIQELELIEGDNGGINIPVNINRSEGHTKDIILNVTGVSDGDLNRLSFTYPDRSLTGGDSNGMINAFLAIDNLPIQAQQRRVIVSANDGEDTATIEVVLNVKPVPAPDIYLLIGQSNMVGFSLEGTKFAGSGEPDEPHERIFQLNVSQNNQNDVFFDESSFTSFSSNVADGTLIVRAEDPLHEPLDTNVDGGKNHSYIGMGLSFAKAALNNTTQNIVLVPSAWSGSAFCDNDNGPLGQWNAQDTGDENLGNTWLYERAITRANIAIEETGGILRGILWHQGESDSNDICAASYENNLDQLARQLRLNIRQDRRGGEARRADSNIPFIVGTMSRGSDDREDLSVFPDAKQTIDNAHRNLQNRLSFSDIAINDDLIPANGYPCGNQSCIHYGAEALREMGARYYDSLVRASFNQ